MYLTFEGALGKKKKQQTERSVNVDFNLVTRLRGKNLLSM